MGRTIAAFMTGIVLITFFIAGFTYIFSTIEEGEGWTNGITTDLSYVKGDIDEETRIAYTTFSSQLDNASNLAADANQENEDRGASAGGVAQYYNKNILNSFFTRVFDVLPIPRVVVALVFGLLATTITILGVRFFFGQDRI